jgi:hypothetical protein
VALTKPFLLIDVDQCSRAERFSGFLPATAGWNVAIKQQLAMSRSECPRVDRVRSYMTWLCTSTALVVAMIVMARALHHFSELGGTGPLQAATQAVGGCAIAVTALSLAILSVPNG